MSGKLSQRVAPRATLRIERRTTDRRGIAVDPSGPTPIMLTMLDERDREVGAILLPLPTLLSLLAEALGGGTRGRDGRPYAEVMEFSW